MQRIDRPKNVWRAATLALALVWASAAGTWAQGLEQTQPAAARTSIAAVSQSAWKLAGEGKFDQALQEVRQAVTGAGEDTPLGALGRDLTVHEEHLRLGRDLAAAEYSRKLSEVAEHLATDRLPEALLAAIRAQDVAEDHAAMLREPVVADLIGRADELAGRHEADSRWLPALTLYGRLHSLHEEVDRERYVKPLERVARRIGLLRLYAPSVYVELTQQYAAERNEPAPEPWAFEQDGWQTQLRGVTQEMLLEAMVFAARDHVEGARYDEMLRGGLEMLRVLLTTRGLEATFPSLADEAAVASFRAALETVEGQIDKAVRPLREVETAGIIRRILSANGASLKLPPEVVLHELGNGTMGTLDDFSGIIWPHAKSRFDRTTTQKFTGVGIQITLVDRAAGKQSAAAGASAPGVGPVGHQLTVVTPLEGSPALRAGIRPGDRIVSIDGKSTSGIDLETAVDKITGPEGTQVTLGVESPGSQEVRQVPLTRATIPIASIKGWSRAPGGTWDYLIDPQLRIGYVRITQFGPDTAGELDSAVQSMIQGGGVGGLILDLRQNPGGRLDAAIDVADRFLDQGVIVSTTGRPLVAMASKPRTYPRFPLIVLINSASASASEIVSGALKDHNRALIVGQRTFGKGSVQNVVSIGEKLGYLKLTTQYYKLPYGRIIHRRPGAAKWGVDPDVSVRMSDQQVFTAAQVRTLLDILRQEGEEIDPSYVLNAPGGRDGEAHRLPTIQSAQDILTQGLDPQLEAAVLLLKTKVIGDAHGLAVGN